MQGQHDKQNNNSTSCHSILFAAACPTTVFRMYMRASSHYSYAAAGDRWGSGPPSQNVSNVILTFWKRWISKKLHRAINRHKYAIFRLTQNACKRMNDEYSLLAIPLPAWFVNHSRAEEIIKPCCNLVMRLLRYCGKNPAEKKFWEAIL